MSTLDKIIREVIAKLPKSILQKVLARKVSEAGLAMPPSALAAFADHILSNSEDIFEWDDGSGVDRKISIQFTKEDADYLEEETNRVLSEIPSITQSTIESAGKVLFKSLIKRWEVERAAQSHELDFFLSRLEDRWGKGLDYLRILLTCCREIGSEASRRYRRSQTKNCRHRRWVLERLHVRACQVSDEIICLLENGFADGAMARWRTLHEISVIACIIADGDEDLAERYILHDAVEVKRQADEYEQSQIPLGAKKIPNRERRSIDSKYAAVLARFGASFAHPYGWASKHLNHKKPTFKELHAASGRSSSSSYYKLASFNIHASARSLFFNLSSMSDEQIMISGRSNFGLKDPGELTAHGLALVTSLFVDSGPDFDRLMTMNCLLEIRDAVSTTLRRSEREIKREEKALRNVSLQAKHRKSRKDRPK